MRFFIGLPCSVKICCYGKPLRADKVGSMGQASGQQRLSKERVGRALIQHLVLRVLQGAIYVRDIL